MATNQGFASLSQAGRKNVSSKGGRKAHEKGKAHQFKSEEARKAALKSHESRRGAAAKKAAIRLIQEFGFTAAELAMAELDEDLYTYYGGPRTTADRIVELREKVRV